MKALLKNFWVALILHWIVGGIFIYAGVAKIQNPQAFADSIASFRLLPSEFVNLLALFLPPFEITAGLLLVIGWQKRLAAFAILVLGIVFAFALSQALIRGLEVDCGCFGSGQPSVWKTWASLGRDLLLVAAAWIIYVRTVAIPKPA